MQTDDIRMWLLSQINKAGRYRYSPTTIAHQIDGKASQGKIKRVVDELVNEGIITRETQKQMVNNRYSTNVFLSIKKAVI